MSIDWSNAPEGATHWDSRGNGCSIGFMKPGIRRGEWEYFGCGGHWILYGLLHRELMDAMVDRPEPQPWNGEGLPPVGILIEAKHKNAQPDWARPGFYETVIVAIGKQLVIFEERGSGHETVGKLSDYLFRPIRTAEQIAAEERDQACTQMLADAYQDLNDAAMRQAQRLYDAGWRKQVQP